MEPRLPLLMPQDAFVPEPDRNPHGSGAIVSVNGPSEYFVGKGVCTTLRRSREGGNDEILPNLRECVPLHTKKSKQPRKLGQIKLHAFFGRAQGLFRAVDGTFHVFDSAMLESPCFRIVFFPRQIVARLFQ